MLKILDLNKWEARNQTQNIGKCSFHHFDIDVAFNAQNLLSDVVSHSFDMVIKVQRV